jgi:tetratricopeptide (TPR) repeat protein
MCLQRFPEFPFFSMLAYLASILIPGGSPEREHEFGAAVANAFCPDADVPHLVHLLDELATAGSGHAMPLARLLLGSGVSQKQLCSRQRLVLPLASLGRIHDSERARKLVDRLAQAKFVAGGGIDRRLPELVPVPEGFEHGPFDANADLARMVESGTRLKEAIAFASAVLDQDPGNKDALFYRAIALARSGKIADAIVDWQTLIKIWPILEAREMERSLWTLFGVSDRSSAGGGPRFTGI